MNKEILEITKKFHDTYEKLASEYTYETREDTKVFDINSNNGKLMYATVNEIVSPILKGNKILEENYDRIYNENCKLREEHNITDISLLDENKKLKDNWNKLKVYIKTEIPEDVFIDTEWFVSILDKMKELEQGSDSNE